MQPFFSFYQRPQIFFGSLQQEEELDDTEIDPNWNLMYEKDLQCPDQTGLFLQWENEEFLAEDDSTP